MNNLNYEISQAAMLKAAEFMGSYGMDKIAGGEGWLTKIITGAAPKGSVNGYAAARNRARGTVAGQTAGRNVVPFSLMGAGAGGILGSGAGVINAMMKGHQRQGAFGSIADSIFGRQKATVGDLIKGGLKGGLYGSAGGGGLGFLYGLNRGQGSADQLRNIGKLTTDYINEGKKNGNPYIKFTKNIGDNDYTFNFITDKNPLTTRARSYYEGFKSGLGDGWGDTKKYLSDTYNKYLGG